MLGKLLAKCLRINATFFENKCNLLTFLLQQKLALMITLRVRYCYVQSFKSLIPPEITSHHRTFIVCSRHIMGVVLHAHPVRGESRIQRNANGEVATL